MVSAKTVGFDETRRSLNMLLHKHWSLRRKQQLIQNLSVDSVAKKGPVYDNFLLEQVFATSAPES